MFAHSCANAYPTIFSRHLILTVTLYYSIAPNALYCTTLHSIIMSSNLLYFTIFQLISYLPPSLSLINIPSHSSICIYYLLPPIRRWACGPLSLSLCNSNNQFNISFVCFLSSTYRLYTFKFLRLENWKSGYMTS